MSPLKAFESLPIAALIGLLFLVACVFASTMLIYRCLYETRKPTPAPAFKGWEAHWDTVATIRHEFQRYHDNRKSGQRVSLQRSKGARVESNRTTEASYKAETSKVDVSDLDGVIALEIIQEPSTLLGQPAHERAVLHVEPSVPQDVIAWAALVRGWMPEVVLEFPGITAGKSRSLSLILPLLLQDNVYDCACSLQVVLSMVAASKAAVISSDPILTLFKISTF
jgi:hypothetical protein